MVFSGQNTAMPRKDTHNSVDLTRIHSQNSSILSTDPARCDLG